MGVWPGRDEELSHYSSSRVIFVASPRSSEGSMRLSDRGCAKGDADAGRRRFSCYSLC